MFKQFVKKATTIKSILLIIFLTLLPFVYFYSKSEYTKLKNDNDKIIQAAIDKKILDSISKVKTFNIENKDNIGLHNISLKSKFENGKVLYMFSADLVDEHGIEFKATTPYPNFPNYNDRLIFRFIDKDGFVIFSEDIYLNTITDIVNEKGERIALNCNGIFSGIKKDIYLKINKVDFNWAF